MTAGVDAALTIGAAATALALIVTLAAIGYAATASPAGRCPRRRPGMAAGLRQ